MNSVVPCAGVSRETQIRLAHYVESLKKWSSVIGLVSHTTMQDMWTRHIADSLQIWPLSEIRSGSWADLGSGGGLPVVPLACMARDCAPDIRFHAVESNARKCVFLRQVVRDLDLAITVHEKRIEVVPPLESVILTSRALAPLPKLLDFCSRHLSAHGKALFPKGKSYVSEIEQALRSWRFGIRVIPSQTNPTSAILEIKDISRA